jgi:hypothetical protein
MVHLPDFLGETPSSDALIQGVNNLWIAEFHRATLAPSDAQVRFGHPDRT